MASILWVIIAFMLFSSLQYFIYIAWGDTFDISFWSRVWVLLSMTALFMVLYWFGINLFTFLVKRQTILGAVKGLYTTGIKKIHRFIVPLIFSLVMMVILNVAMFFLVILKWQVVFLVGAGLLLLAYLTLLRFYFTDVIYDTVPRKHAAEKTKAKRINKTSGSKKK